MTESRAKDIEEFPHSLTGLLIADFEAKRYRKWSPLFSPLWSPLAVMLRLEI